MTAALLGPLNLLSGEGTPPPGGAALTDEYPNLFKTYLGKTDAEVAAKLEGAFDQLFYGDPFTERIYYTDGPDTAYLADVECMVRGARLNLTRAKQVMVERNIDP